jgi:hypothetical protein
MMREPRRPLTSGTRAIDRLQACTRCSATLIRRWHTQWSPSSPLIASAVLLHSIAPRDGMIGRMTFHLVKVRPRREYPEPIAGTASPASSPSECRSTIQPRAGVQGIATRLQSIRIVGT